MNAYYILGIVPNTLHLLSNLSLITPLIYLGRKRTKNLGGNMTILHTKEMKQREVKSKVTQLTSSKVERPAW